MLKFDVVADDLSEQTGGQVSAVAQTKNREICGLQNDWNYGIVVNETTGEITTNGNASLSAFAIIMLIIVGVWALAILLPTLSVMVRRLHDADHSGWWWWINLVCFGWIVLLIFWVSEGTRGANRFGPDPKA